MEIVGIVRTPLSTEIIDKPGPISPNMTRVRETRILLWSFWKFEQKKKLSASHEISTIGVN